MDGAASALSRPGAPSGAGIATEDVLAGLRSRVEVELAPQVERIDRDGFYPESVMRSLGEGGLFALHLAGPSPLAGPSLGAAVEAMALVGETCMSTAFCTWCQDACGWYLELSPNAALRERLQPDIAGGALLGGTGLSNPIKAAAGIEPFKLKAKRAAGGYVVSGILPWVSNLGAGHHLGTVFEDADDPAHRIMALVECGQPGVEIRQNAHFIALEGTATYCVLFRRALVADEQLLADPAADLMRRVRPGFVLLQTGMGLGVIAACVQLMREADRTQGATNQYLPTRPDDVEYRLAKLRGAILDLAQTPAETAPEFLRAVLEARLATSELTLEATSAAMLHGGARSYLEGSAMARRQREGSFVALITPSIRHLRQELAGMARH
ncbi:MAG: acyl-CoA/acyl-ACP dehydrogenase [Acetobacteraceae bacterium]|nr:acyl-CoA/acyl-ACP dehydrogenase [Acetobacteraceae bacterium]